MQRLQSVGWFHVINHELGMFVVKEKLIGLLPLLVVVLSIVIAGYRVVRVAV